METLQDNLKIEHLTQNIKTTTNLDEIKSNLPQYFDKDGNFDLDKFQKDLEVKDINFSKESYGMDWLGKSYARLLATDPTTTLLKEDKYHNSKDINQNSENLLIKGDNLEVLKHLSKAYYRKIKMIYIDPPYNTGSDGFVYEDDRKFTIEQFSELAGVSRDKAKRILDFTKGKSNSHSAWLTFMYPRLYIARQLLKDDGVIFISIDDNEVAQLKLLMDEIFGEENFVAEMIWNTGRKSTAKLIAVNHEYCLIYSKEINKQLNIVSNTYNEDEDISTKVWREKKQGLDIIYKKYNDLKKENGNNFVKISKELKEFYKSLSEDNQAKNHKHYNYVDENGIYFPDNTSAPDKPETRSHKPLIHPITKKLTAVPLLGWRYSDDKLNELVLNGRIHFGKDETTVPNKKTYLHETEFTIPNSVFYKDARGAKSRLKKLFNDIDVFAFPKDEEIIKKFINLCVTIDNTDIILDFFAGSGTTGDAVMQLNSEDGGNRKYILVQIPEPIDEKKNKASYDFVKNELEVDKPTIFEITKERLIRAANKIKKDNEGKLNYEENNLDLGFKIFETTPIWDNYKFNANELSNELEIFDSSTLDNEDLMTLMTTWKVQDGIFLNQNLEIIDLDGYIGHYFDNKLYLMYRGFEIQNLVAIYNKIENDKSFNPTKIIVFGYNFESARLLEISGSLKVTNKKNSEIELIVRY